MSPAAPRSRTSQAGADYQSLVPLRPQGPLELVDRASNIVRLRAADLIGVALAIQLPIWLFLAILQRDRWATGLKANGAWPSASAAGGFASSTMWASNALKGNPLVVLAAIVLPSLGLALMGTTAGILIRDWSLGRPTRGMAALGQAIRRLHVIAALWLLVHVIELVTVVGTAMGPVIFGIAAPLLGMETSTPIVIIRRCWNLCWREFWRSLAAVVSAGALALVVGNLLAVAPIFLLRSLTSDAVNLAGTASTALASAIPHLLLDPIIAVSMALLALDLKIRCEGLDLEVLLTEVGNDAR